MCSPRVREGWSLNLRVAESNMCCFMQVQLADCLGGSSLAQPSPSLSVRTHHKFRKIRSVLYQKVRTSASEKNPLSAKCLYWTNPLTADIFYRRPLGVKDAELGLVKTRFLVRVRSSFVSFIELVCSNVMSLKETLC